MFFYVLWIILSVCGGLASGFVFVFNAAEITTLIVLAGIGIAVCGFIVIYILSIIWFFIRLGVLSLFYSTKKEYKSVSKAFLAVYNSWCYYFLKLFRVSIKVTGIEKVPTDKKCLFVCNHRSNFDPFINTCTYRKTPISLISKKEAFNIPFIGRMMKRAMYLSMDRNDIRSSLVTIMKAIEYIKNDFMNVCVFPEGTRSKTNELLEFKSGCFKIAETCQCPIVIGVMKGTEKIKDNFPWKPTKVYYEIVEVVQPEDFKSKTIVEISDYVHNVMKAKLEEEK